MTAGKTSDSKSPIRIVLVFLGLAVLAGLIYLLPVGEYLQKTIRWVDTLGFWGPAVYIAVYIVAVILFLPGSILTAAAGTLFGIGWGTLYVSFASTIGATLAFLVGRYLARGWVEKKISGSSKFAAIDDAVARQGWKIVVLTRLSPVFPFNLLNYAYGITRVKPGHYVLASWIGMLPGTLLYVYLGSLGKAAAEAEDKTVAEWTMYGVGLLATVAVTVFITRISRKALQQKIES